MAAGALASAVADSVGDREYREVAAKRLAHVEGPFAAMAHRTKWHGHSSATSHARPSTGAGRRNAVVRFLPQDPFTQTLGGSFRGVSSIHPQSSSQLEQRIGPDGGPWVPGFVVGDVADYEPADPGCDSPESRAQFFDRFRRGHRSPLGAGQLGPRRRGIAVERFGQRPGWRSRHAGRCRNRLTLPFAGGAGRASDPTCEQSRVRRTGWGWAAVDRRWRADPINRRWGGRRWFRWKQWPAEYRAGFGGARYRLRRKHRHLLHPGRQQCQSVPVQCHPSRNHTGRRLDVSDQRPFSRRDGHDEFERAPGQYGALLPVHGGRRPERDWLGHHQRHHVRRHIGHGPGPGLQLLPAASGRHGVRRSTHRHWRPAGPATGRPTPGRRRDQPLDPPAWIDD